MNASTSYDVRIIYAGGITIIDCADEKEASDIFCKALKRTDRPLRVTIREWENGKCRELDNFYMAKKLP